MLSVGGILVSVGPTSVAYVPPDCRGDCPLSVTGLADGRTRSYRLPPDTGNPGVGAFAPDGRRLALGVPGQYRDGRLIIVPGFAEVLDLRTGEFVRVPRAGHRGRAGARPELVGRHAGARGLVRHRRPGGQLVGRPARTTLRVLPAEPRRRRSRSPR